LKPNAEFRQSGQASDCLSLEVRKSKLQSYSAASAVSQGLGGPGALTLGVPGKERGPQA